MWGGKNGQIFTQFPLGYTTMFYNALILQAQHRPTSTNVSISRQFRPCYFYLCVPNGPGAFNKSFVQRLAKPGTNHPTIVDRQVYPSFSGVNTDIWLPSTCLHVEREGLLQSEMLSIKTNCGGTGPRPKRDLFR